MNKIVKWIGISDLVLILIYAFFRNSFNFSSTIDYSLISFFIGILFFVLFIFVFTFIKNIFLRRKKKNKKLNYEATKMIYTFGIVLSIFVMLICFNFALYIQALLGNDLFVSLSLDKENVFLKNGDNVSINVQYKIITNPFCSANCSTKLFDLSSGDVLSSENVHLLVANPISKDYLISVNENVSGQKLYRVELDCSSEKTILCYTTSNKSKQVTKIISIEHNLNDEQNKSLEGLKNRINSLNSQYNQMILNLIEINNTIYNSSSLDLSQFESASSSLLAILKSKNIGSLIFLANEQKYNFLQDSISKEESDFILVEDKFSKLNDSINSDIDSYNILVDNFSSLKENVSQFYSIHLNNDSIFSVNNFVDKFNLAVDKFNSKNKLEFKDDIFQNISLDFANLILQNTNDSILILNKSISDLNVSKIYLNFNEQNFSLNFSSPSEICCLNNNCTSCLDEKSSSINYPIILLHGHSFNEKVSALASLDIFNPLQNNLENDGYVNAGSFLYTNYDNESRGVLGKINKPVSIKASYYFDVLSTSAGSFLLETKTDNIDTYTLRLREIIQNVKYLTGKDKVIVVAHSMGGLVIRRYAQVFGTDDLDKIILVTVPNHGIDGFVVSYCSLFGTPLECSDMNSNSLFLNKLNRDDKINIPVYNIIGVGCSWENSIGDGIVKNNSAYLDFAKNYYVNGTCDGFNYFHSNVLDIEKYPEVYKIINQSLRD